MTLFRDTLINNHFHFSTSFPRRHMLTFLALASKKGFVVSSYTDSAVGILGRNNAGKTAITRIDLKPAVTFAADHCPPQQQFDQLQQRAHTGCFIANSIASCINVGIEAKMLFDGQ